MTAPKRDTIGPFTVPAELAEAFRKAAADAGCTQAAMLEAVLRSALRRKVETGREVVRAIERGPAAALAVANRLAKKGRTLEEIAAELNRLGYRTARDRAWNLVAVHRLLRT